MANAIDAARKGKTMILKRLRAAKRWLKPPAPITGSAPTNLPPLPKARQTVYEYYRLDFAPDGCPMRRMDDGRLVFHPILIPYLVVDYLKLYRSTNDRACLEYARLVMDHALNRAEPDRDELLFFYDPESGLSSIPHRFYSALTQSWYVKALAQLEEHYPGTFGHDLCRAFASLSIPIDQGGVLIKRDFGWMIEEYPHEPPLYTLNGWLTAIRMVLEALPVLESFNIETDEFLRRNLDAAEHLLPLYDAGFCWNTRYQLTGFTRLKIVTDRSAGLACTRFSIAIPGERTIEADLAPPAKPSRWNCYLERENARLLQFNIIQSMISFPDPNRYQTSLHCDQDCEATVFIADGDYDWELSAMPTTRWREIGRHALRAGTNQIEGAIPFDDRNMFAYPTNFKKKIGGKHFNAYHIIHIVDLAVLYAATGREAFAVTARQWLGYMDRWPDMPEIADPTISKTAHLYGDKLGATVEKYLGKRHVRKL